MKRILGMVAMVVLLVACTACDDGNLIKDPALRACIQAEWDTWAKDKHYDINNKDDLANVFSTFACESKGVKSLEGFEYLVNVTQLRLSGNEIKDFSPLAGHEKLISLDLDSNGIREIDSLHDLNVLHSVSLMGNFLKDIRLLKQFASLADIAIIDNCITDFNQCDEVKQTISEVSIVGCTASDQHPEKCQ